MSTFRSDIEIGESKMVKYNRLSCRLCVYTFRLTYIVLDDIIWRDAPYWVGLVETSMWPLVTEMNWETGITLHNDIAQSFESDMAKIKQTRSLKAVSYYVFSQTPSPQCL